MNYEKEKQELVNEVRAEIYRFIQSAGKEIVIQELKKIDIPKVLMERINAMVQAKFIPIIQNAVNLSVQRVAGKINKQLKQVICLKTSTIMEIQTEINKIPAEVEEESLKQLAQDFPEYYKQITETERLKITQAKS